MSAMFLALRGMNYRLWFAGALISNVGLWMQRTAQDWLVLTELTDNDATALGVSLARASLPPGAQSQAHVLDFLEIYYFLSGQGVMHVGTEAVPVGPEACLYLPPGSVQWLENSSCQASLDFLCICHPAWFAEGDHVLDPA